MQFTGICSGTLGWEWCVVPMPPTTFVSQVQRMWPKQEPDGREAWLWGLETCLLKAQRALRIWGQGWPLLCMAQSGGRGTPLPHGRLPNTHMPQEIKSVGSGSLFCLFLVALGWWLTPLDPNLLTCKMGTIQIPSSKCCCWGSSRTSRKALLSTLCGAYHVLKYFWLVFSWWAKECLTASAPEWMK